MYGLATTYVPRRRRDAINRSQSAPALHRGGKTPRDGITPHDHRSQSSTVTYGSISTTYIGLPPRIDHVEGRKQKSSGGMRRVASAASWIPHRDEDEIHDHSAILASLTASQIIETATLLPSTQPKNVSNDTVPIALTCLASCGALLFGIHIGYSSPFEDDVRAASSMSQVETDFMFSLISIGAVMGSFLAGPLSNEMGRRMAIVMTCIPYIFGALMMTFLPSLLYLSIGRLLCGVGVGLSSVLTPLYIAEISPPHLRGGLGAANQFFLTLGLVLINALGIPGISNKSWWSIIMLSTLIPVGVMACGMLMVGLETPGWLLAHQKSDDALSVLRRLRGPHWDCRGELLEMSDYEEVGAGVVTDIPTIYSVDGEEDEEIDDVSDSESMSSRSPGAPSPALKGGLHSPVLQHGEGQVQVAISSTPPPPLVFAPSPCTSPPPQVSAWRLFFLPRAFIPFMIGVVLQLMQQWSGINAFMFHTKALLGGNSADGSTTPADAYTALYGAIAVNGIQVIMTGAAMLLMDRAGRRTWLISSCIGLSVISYLMGYAYYAGASNVVKILLVMLYVTFFAIGLGPLPWLMCGELFHSSVRSTAMSIATVVNWTSAFLVTATFGMFESLVTTSGVFWCYGTVALLGATFVYFIVPETRGKSLDEIETLFEKRGEHDEMDTADDETWPQAIIQQREGEAYVME